MDWDRPIMDDEMWRQGCFKTLNGVLTTLLIGWFAVGAGL